MANPTEDRSSQPLPRRHRIVYSLACAMLVVVIVGLLVATWMPAIVQRLDPSPTTRPTSRQS